MTVLTPFVLLGLVALAVPILLHLLRRQERRTRVFPALRYLKRSTREHARIVRLRQLLLLALRLAAVILVSLAGARLVLPLGGRDDPPAAIALIMDNGLTSAAVVGEGRVLDSLAATAAQALSRTGPRDQVWIVPSGAPDQTSVPMSPDRALAAIEALTPTHVTSSLRSSLDRAGSLLDAAPSELRELILVSDLRPEAFESGTTGDQPRSERVLVAPAPTAPSSNRGIGSLSISGGMTPRAGELGQIEVTVIGSDVGGATVRGYVDERLVGTAVASEDGTAVLPLPRLPVGWVRGRVEVEPDGLRGDDVAYFGLRAIPPPTVQILGPVSSFVEEAVSVLDQAGRIRLVQSGEAVVQVLSGGSPATPSPAAALIVIPPDESALLPALNQRLATILPDWSLEATTPVGEVEARVASGSLAGFLPTVPNVRLAYAIRAQGSEPDWSELMTLSDGRPWIVESATPERSVIVLASPMTLEASDLPSSASMLPLMELLVSRSTDSPGRGQVRPGEPLRLPPAAAIVRLPDDTERVVTGGGMLRDTHSAGVYEVLDSERQILSLIPVNPISPGSLASLTASEAAARLEDAWENARPGDPWPRSVLTDRRGREVSGPLLLGLLFVLVAESWLASVNPRGSRSPAEPTTEVEPS